MKNLKFWTTLLWRVAFTVNLLAGVFMAHMYIKTFEILALINSLYPLAFCGAIYIMLRDQKSIDAYKDLLKSKEAHIAEQEDYIRFLIQEQEKTLEVIEKHESTIKEAYAILEKQQNDIDQAQDEIASPENPVVVEEKQSDVTPVEKKKKTVKTKKNSKSPKEGEDNNKTKRKYNNRRSRKHQTDSKPYIAPKVTSEERAEILQSEQ